MNRWPNSIINIIYIQWSITICRVTSKIISNSMVLLLAMVFILIIIMVYFNFKLMSLLLLVYNLIM